MHIAFLTIPSSGQANVQLATAQALLDKGHQVTILSGRAFSGIMQKLQQKQTDEKKRLSLDFISLGSEGAFEDL
jgi:UDP:flavonoid glycosyltransferase YjiC (YdhE family)